MKIAFYKGRRNLVDKIIQFVTRSKFSHVELVHPENDKIFLSSSGMDGGVRYRKFTNDFNPENWEIIELENWFDEKAWENAEKYLGAKYDFLGIFFSQGLSFNRHDKKKWFCSELVAYSLGIKNPHKLSPGDLYDTILMLNTLYSMKKFAD